MNKSILHDHFYAINDPEITRAWREELKLNTDLLKMVILLHRKNRSKNVFITFLSVFLIVTSIALIIDVLS